MPKPISSTSSASSKSKDNDTTRGMAVIISHDIWKKLNSDETRVKTANNMKISELENVILQASHAYYNSDKLLISDDIFDTLVDILRQRSPNSTILKQIGSELPAGASNKVPLPYHLGSMDKIKPGSRELSLWLSRYSGPYTISEKLDGLSGLLIISLKHNDNKDLDSGDKDLGLDMRLYTRGNGKVGQDVSHLLPFLNPIDDKGKDVIIKELKKTMMNKDKKNVTKNANVHIAIRGEIILSKTRFESKYSKDYPKARSFVAGLVNAKAKKYDSQIYRNKASDMEFVSYQLITPKGLTSREQFDILDKKWGLSVAKNETIPKLDDVLQLEELLISYKDVSPYEIDGIIVADDSKVWPQPSSGNPKHSVAFKMALDDQTKETTVINVMYNVSKQGYLKPRVQFTPVMIGGDKIQYATGFNAKFIKDNKLGPGAKIKVIKSGDVIPYIKHVISPAKDGKWQEPELEYKWTDTEVDALVEDPSKNTEYISSRLTYFFNVMEVDGLRQGTIDRLIEAGFDSVNLILSLKSESLVNVDGFGNKAINNLLAAIKRGILNKEHPIEKVMAASGCFPGFGRRKIAAIINGLTANEKEMANKKYVTSLNNELTTQYDEGNKTAIIQMNRLTSIPSIAKITAKLFINNLNCFHKWLDNNDKVHVTPLTVISSEEKKANPANSKPDSKLKQIEGVTGKAVLFTGFRNASLENKLISEYGVSMKSTMSGQVELLVVADTSKKNGKMIKAEKLGIPIISVSELEKKMS